MECGGVVGGSKWSARQVQCVGVHIKVSPRQVQCVGVHIKVSPLQVQCVGVHIKVSPRQVQCVGVHIKVSPLQVERQFVQKTTLPSGIPIHLSSTSTPFATLTYFLQCCNSTM